MERVNFLKSAIAEGSVYQVNLCRLLRRSVRLGNLGPEEFNRVASDLLYRHPCPEPAALFLPEADLRLISISPELFLSVDGEHVITRPIKGTAAEGHEMLEKDFHENIMIVDLMRNDLSKVCKFGSVAVTELCAYENHPGLSHLVSTVTGRLGEDFTWPSLLNSLWPPGSVSGAPKAASLKFISSLEPVPRNFYCGSVGWIDATAGTARLNVAIRTFCINNGVAVYGTGAGITYDSDPMLEWEETETKARRAIEAFESSLARLDLPPYSQGKTSSLTTSGPTG